MAELSPELVQRLARHRGGVNPVVSLYLNIDGRKNIRPDQYRQRLEHLMKESAHSADPQAKDDLERIKSFVADFERSSERSLAVFSSGDELWESVSLHLPVEDHLVVNQTPHVRQLENMLDEWETVGVLLTDRQRARLLVFELGRVVEREDVVDPLPRHDDDKGDWRKDHVKAHADVAVQHHIRHAAQQMFEMFQRRRFDNLLVCAGDDIRPEVERQLHNYLQSRLLEGCNLTINSSEEEIAAVGYEKLQQAERLREAEVIAKLRAAVAESETSSANGNQKHAVVGLEPTLNAVFEKRVDTLVVSEGYVAEGWRCSTCQYIAAVGRRCRMCGEQMAKVDDVVEEAVEDALGQKCRVEFCYGSADLDVMGRIGALLRF